jgi:hypothetical protein
MSISESKFPFFIPIEPRQLSERETALLNHLVTGQTSNFAKQIGDLQVVGRCGCGACPTIFFLPYQQGESEADLVTRVGTDSFGGLTAVVLLVKAGALSQLEFYSADGHEPWDVPNVHSLATW